MRKEDERFNYEHSDPRSNTKVATAFVIFLVVLGCILIYSGVSRSAEPPRYELTLIYPGEALEEVSRSFLRLGPDTFPDKESCEKTAKNLRVWMGTQQPKVRKPARVRCDVSEESR